jgi:hypothetical protein
MEMYPRVWQVVAWPRMFGIMILPQHRLLSSSHTKMLT